MGSHRKPDDVAIARANLRSVGEDRTAIRRPRHLETTRHPLDPLHAKAVAVATEGPGGTLGARRGSVPGSSSERSRSSRTLASRGHRTVQERVPPHRRSLPLGLTTRARIASGATRVRGRRRAMIRRQRLASATRGEARSVRRVPSPAALVDASHWRTCGGAPAAAQNSVGRRWVAVMVPSGRLQHRGTHANSSSTRRTSWQATTTRRS